MQTTITVMIETVMRLVPQTGVNGASKTKRARHQLPAHANNSPEKVAKIPIKKYSIKRIFKT